LTWIAHAAYKRNGSFLYQGKNAEAMTLCAHAAPGVGVPAVAHD
jgi:hypothetical protein